MDMISQKLVLDLLFVYTSSLGCHSVQWLNTICILMSLLRFRFVYFCICFCVYQMIFRCFQHKALWSPPHTHSSPILPIHDNWHHYAIRWSHQKPCGSSWCLYVPSLSVPPPPTHSHLWTFNSSTRKRVCSSSNVNLNFSNSSSFPPPPAIPGKPPLFYLLSVSVIPTLSPSINPSSRAIWVTFMNRNTSLPRAKPSSLAFSCMHEDTRKHPNLTKVRRSSQRNVVSSLVFPI